MEADGRRGQVQRARRGCETNRARRSSPACAAGRA
jgi:hypothetical protein